MASIDGSQTCPITVIIHTPGAFYPRHVVLGCLIHMDVSGNKIPLTADPLSAECNKEEFIIASCLPAPKAGTVGLWVAVYERTKLFERRVSHWEMVSRYRCRTTTSLCQQVRIESGELDASTALLLPARLKALPPIGQQIPLRMRIQPAESPA
ncbi:hypothetical protein Micbo1qcDRAFT_181146 [Microdochium bolleyi]|uniref:Uncharacterized protein n=1 Tax=Microdochium bolleyi TaxID=196109 RepID=A0A136IJV5_9PEZI|nr:hypothetical protein Micbo1qcDRAFT_181146 [Microdochium bolleyi]